MKISVVMTTYNGIKYIEEQLDSIKNQIMSPTEVIIMDDASTDGTTEFVREYISRNRLDSWFLYVNKINIGWKANFKNGIEKSKGDIIFLSDQDDIWHSDKIYKMSSVLERDNNIELLVSDYNVIYATNTVNDGYEKNLRRTAFDETVEKINFDEKWMYVLRPGCVFAFKRGLYERIRNIWDCNNAHDSNLWRAAIVFGTLYIYHYATIDFRRHGDNETSGKKTTRDSRIYDCKGLIRLNNELMDIAQKYNLDIEYSIFRNEADFLRYRQLFLSLEK